MVKCGHERAVAILKLTSLKKKCQICNRVNLTLVLLIIILSALVTWMSIRAGMDFEEYMFGLMSFVIGLVALLIGRFLPTKESNAYMSGKFVGFIALANLALNHRSVSPSVLKGGPIVRTWNFAAFLIFAAFMGLFNCMGAWLFCSEETLMLSILYGITCALWLMLVPFCGFWTYYDSCISEIEKHGESFEGLGKKSIRQMIYSSIAFFLVAVLPFLIAAILSYAGSHAKPDKPTEFTQEQITQQISAARKKLETVDPEEFYESMEFDNIGEALVDIQHNFNNQKFYYLVQYFRNDTIHIVTWMDAGQEVYIDSFHVLKHDRLKRTSSFLSSSLTKADFEGKETGILE